MNTDEHRFVKRTCLVLCAWCLALGVAAQEPSKRTPEQEKQIARAQEILDEARKAAFTIPRERRGERSSLLQAIAVSCAEAGDVDGALLTMGALEADQPEAKASVLGWIAVHQARSGDVSAALETLKSVEREDLRSIAMKHVASQLAEQGYVGPARQFIDQIEDQQEKDSALTKLAYAQLSRGDAAGARQIASEIKGEQTRRLVTGGIAYLESQPPERQKAAMHTGQFPAVNLGAPGVRTETAPFRVWLPITGLLVAADESENPAVTHIREAVHAALEVGRKGDAAEGLQRLEEAAQLADSLAAERDRADQLWLVAAAQAELGRPEQALGTMRLISKEGEGDPRAAYLLTTGIRSIAQSQAAAGKVDEALAWADAESDATLKAAALLGVADGILRRMEMDSWSPEMREYMLKGPTIQRTP